MLSNFLKWPKLKKTENVILNASILNSLVINIYLTSQFYYCSCKCMIIEMAYFILWLVFLNRNCWQNYVDYHRCLKVKGADYSPCEYFKKAYVALCPNEWVCFSHCFRFIHLLVIFSVARYFAVI